MAIIINNGVQNILGTPGAISGVAVDRPAAPDVAEGTLYFATDTFFLYQSIGGVWISYAGGGGGGGVNSVIGIKPISSSGGTDPEISITQAGVASDGYLSEGDWNIFNSKLNAVTASLPLSSTGGTDPDISISQAGIVSDGYLNSIDWNTFNDKIGGGGAATRVAFFTAGKVITGSAQFIWDFTNNRLGVGGSPFGYKLSVIEPNYFARFGTTAGSDANAITFGKSTSSAIALFGSASERKILIGDGATGFANFTAYTDNIIQFSYSNATGGAQLSPILTLFSGNFFYSAGTNTHTQIYLKPSIQTSGGTNLLRGIYYAPIKTTDTGTRQIAFESTEGDIIAGVSGQSYFNLDFTNLIFDFGNNAIGNCVRVNESGGAIEINGNTQISMLASNAGFFAVGDETTIGDVDGRNNSTYFGVNDNGSKLFGSSNLITNIGAATTDRIKINIGGTEYLIVLEKA